MTNRQNTVLYTGVTSDLKKRVWQHREKLVQGFTKRYKITRLVYYEVFDDILSAIQRENRSRPAHGRRRSISSTD
jgi:putative endonuclease